MFGSVRWLEHGTDLELRGIDGLVRQGNQLFVIQNGVLPNRVPIPIPNCGVKSRQ